MHFHLTTAGHLQDPKSHTSFFINIHKSNTFFTVISTYVVLVLIGVTVGQEMACSTTEVDREDKDRGWTVQYTSQHWCNLVESNRTGTVRPTFSKLNRR